MVESNLLQGRLVSKVSITSVYVMLQALLAEQEMGSSTTTGQTLTEQILQVMETILQEASEQPPDQYKVRISPSFVHRVSIYKLKDEIEGKNRKRPL